MTTKNKCFDCKLVENNVVFLQNTFFYVSEWISNIRTIGPLLFMQTNENSIRKTEVVDYWKVC